MDIKATPTFFAGLILVACPFIACDSEAQALVQTIERDSLGIAPRFGAGDLTIDGDELLVGCPHDRLGPGGVVYRFQRVGDRYIPNGSIFDATTSESGSFFGENIIVEGDRMVISAHGWNDSRGRSFVFERNGEDWIRTTTLTPTTLRFDEHCGIRTDARGPFVAMGGPNPFTSGSEDFGRVVIFVEDSDGWREAQVLQPNATENLRDYFGWSVVFVEDDVLAVGAPNTGEVYLYRLVGDAWVEEQVIQMPRAFGWSLETNDGILFVGDKWDSEAGFRAGAVYAFEHDGSAWVQRDKLLPSDGPENGQLGEEIACHGNFVLVGAFGEEGNGNWGRGKAYLYERVTPSECIERTTFVAPDPDEQDFLADLFAYSALLSANVAICSANGQFSESGEGRELQGAVYVFDLDRQQAPLTDFTIAFGSLESGELDWLRRSGNAHLIARSQFGFAATEPNLVDLRIGATSPIPTPASIDLSIEGRLSQIGGTARVRLRNWSTNQFQQVHQYPIGSGETIEDIEDIDAANRVRGSDGRIEVSLRQSVMATFSATGFQSFNDWVGVAVRE